ncbi:MAG: winged helix-turn-helix transcriptional regulator [Myxococcota bacterium]
MSETLIENDSASESTAAAVALKPSGDRANRKSEILRPAQIFDPVARALDVIGDRWSLVIVRQLLAGAKGFQELRVRTGIAPRVLSSRLRQMRSDGFVETEAQGTRSLYCVTEKGRSLEPIISSIAKWWVREGINALDIDASRFTETSALSVLEALPNLLREDAVKGRRVVFEIRLSGEGGGVWAVVIDEGHCEVIEGFAEGADVRYTATARDWCAVALGVLDAREAVKQGRLHKEGAGVAMDDFFHQIAGARSVPSKDSD